MEGALRNLLALSFQECFAFDQHQTKVRFRVLAQI
jgi:hypothetical protein